ncbi:MAG: CarboxypepD reg-like domain [Candidatus Hydrogenedentota bacterium]
MSTKHLALCLLSCATLALAGCPREVLLRGDQPDEQGNPKPSVVDVNGEALPGVAVSIYGTDRQTVTSATGQYRLSAPLGSQQIDFFKTGYTPARLVLEIAEPGSVPVPQTLLWPLPESQGIFFFERGRYRTLTRVEPRRFLSGDAAVFGSKKGAESFVDLKTNPMLILFRLPGYDLQLSRLRQAEVTPSDAGPAAQQYKVPAWVAEARLSVHTQPVDQPLGLLVQVVPDTPLEPGDYALHWGAYDGHFTTEARAYLFRVLPEAEPEPAASESNAESTVAPNPE